MMIAILKVRSHRGKYAYPYTLENFYIEYVFSSIQCSRDRVGFEDSIKIMGI